MIGIFYALAGVTCVMLILLIASLSLDLLRDLLISCEAYEEKKHSKDKKEHIDDSIPFSKV